MKIDTSQIQHLKAICLLNKKSIFKPSYWLVAIISILVHKYYVELHIYIYIPAESMDDLGGLVNIKSISKLYNTNDEKGRFVHH